MYLVTNACHMVQFVLKANAALAWVRTGAVGAAALSTRARTGQGVWQAEVVEAQCAAYNSTL